MEKETALRIIHDISENLIATPDIVEHFTLDTSERIKQKANEWREQIQKLVFFNDASLLRSVTGPFGAGKTHFMYYFEKQLQYLTDKSDTLEIWVSLRRLQRPDDFQYLLFKGVKTIGGESATSEAWIQVYNRLADRIISKYDANVTNVQRYALIHQIMDGFFDGAESIANLNIPSRWMARRILNTLRKKYKDRVNNVNRKEQFGSNANRAYQREFLDNLLALGEGKLSFDRLDKVAQEINRSAMYGDLIDVMFRLFWLAGYKRVVVFVDEFERIHSTNVDDEVDLKSEWTREILNNFFNFYDDAVLNAGKTYPSIVQILSMPDNIYRDLLAKADRALKNRFNRSDRVELGAIDEITMCNSHFLDEMIQIFQYAGYKLKVDLLRRDKDKIWGAIYIELVEAQESAILRNLLPKIISKISQEYLL